LPQRESGAFLKPGRSLVGNPELVGDDCLRNRSPGVFKQGIAGLLARNGSAQNEPLTVPRRRERDAFLRRTLAAGLRRNIGGARLLIGGTERVASHAHVHDDRSQRYHSD
jgi:hypothetical protein